MQNTVTSLRGSYRDVLRAPDNVVLYDSGWKANTIVDRCRLLLAGFMRSDASSGIHHLTVGQGDEAWDDDGIPDVDPANTIALINAADPVIEDLDFVYLTDDDPPVEVEGPTRCLEARATLQPGYPGADGTTYPLREFGLFGQFGDDFYMVNCVRHAVIHKGPNATLFRVVRLYF